MDKQNHNTSEYSVAEAAHLVGRSAQTIRNFCNDKVNPIDHKTFGNIFVITELGLQQARERIANAKPGPKGPRTKKPKRRTNGSAS